MLKKKLLATSLLMCAGLLAFSASAEDTDQSAAPSESSDNKEQRNAQASDVVPALDSRVVGRGPVLNDDGTVKKWTGPFPLFAQKVLDLGFDLPNPYGVSLIANSTTQGISLSNLNIVVNGGDKTPIDFLDFNNTAASARTGVLQLDFWVLPFVNAFVFAGWSEGNTSLGVEIDGEGFMGLVGLEDKCEGLRPADICSDTFKFQIFPDFKTTSYGGGLNVAAGWKNFIFAMPSTYSEATLDAGSGSAKAFTIAPRIGLAHNMPNHSMLVGYAGISYLRTWGTLNDTFYVGDDFSLEYFIDQTNTVKINYVVGMHWNIDKHWNVGFEAQGGTKLGARQSVMAIANYRF